MNISTKWSGGSKPIYSTSSQMNALADSDRTQMAEKVLDKVSLSRESTFESQFRKELASRIVNEVRTANTTGNIQRIKDMVSNGEYKPDATAIAARLLLEENSSGNT